MEEVGLNQSEVDPQDVVSDVWSRSTSRQGSDILLAKSHRDKVNMKKQIGDSTSSSQIRKSNIPSHDTAEVAECIPDDISECGDATAHDEPTKPRFHILVLNDIICPWCWIAKRRLDSAIASLQDKLDFTVQYSPFLLRPNCPVDGVPNPDSANEESPSLRLQYLREVGADHNVELNMSCPIIPNSVPALTLRQYVRDNNLPDDVEEQVVEKLFEAYFTFGQSLNRDQLLLIAKDLDLDLREVDTYLDNERNEERVRNQAELWRKQGIKAVPFFFMNGKAACSGAQETEDFVKTILKVAETFPEMEENTMDVEFVHERLFAKLAPTDQ